MPNAYDVSTLRAKLAPAQPWGYNLLDADGNLFTWCETREEAFQRQDWEREIFGRLLTLTCNYDC
jgi:hypothetical protein